MECWEGRRGEGSLCEKFGKMSRKEKRRELKKLKRKQLRREAALVSAQEEGEEDEEALVQDQREDEEALAREQAEHDEQERLWLLREEEARKEWLRKQELEAERKVCVPVLSLISALRVFCRFKY